MASHLNESARRTRTAPPRTKKPKGPTTLEISPSGAVLSPGAIEVILSGGGVLVPDNYIAALQQLEERGVLRVQAFVGVGERASRQFSNAFPRALPVQALDAVVLAPGALVVLASSPHLHPVQAGAAIRRGWHVLSIEPLARSVRDATAMIGLAHRNERVLAAAFPWRFSPAVDYLRVLCRDQLIGPLLRFEIREGALVARNASDTGDGVVLEFGLYIFELLTWCIGVPTITRYADDAMGGAEANAFVELTLPEGVHGIVHLSNDWPPIRCSDFVFERGIVRWCADEPNRLTLQLASAPAALEANVVPRLAPDQSAITAPSSPVAHIVAQLENVVGAIAHRAPLGVPTADALTAINLVERCHAQRTLLDFPWFSRNETAHARSLSTPADLPRP